MIVNPVDWNKIDRKKREFRKGDIVSRFQGEFFEILDVSESGKNFTVLNTTTRMGYLVYNRFQCELICPVEYRVEMEDENHDLSN